jgi:SAM-dependent methyltransferase
MHEIREMFFGTRERFKYVECSICGCLSIEKIPTDLSRYYPSNYYSKAGQNGAPQPIWKIYIKRQRTRFWLSGPRILGRVLALGNSSPWFINALRPLGLGLDDRILDVGSGSGELLINMAAQGFTNLTGIDPFIERDITYANGVTIQKRKIAELHSNFDLIMFNHSFEHLANPREVLVHTRRLLARAGHVLIRLPIADSFAWRQYGVNWYQLDAPRHLVIHTRKSIELLAYEVGLRLLRIDYDSNDTQFWVSEAYQRDVPLIDAIKEQHSFEAIARWRGRAAALNAQGTGDQASFYFAM